MNRSFQFIVVALLTLSLSACATRTRLPDTARTMADIHDDALAAPRNEPIRLADSGPSDAGPQSWSQSRADEIEQRFPLLPNPTLVMYVFPHLAGDLPVPGYVTAFPMYETAHFALPGELP